MVVEKTTNAFQMFQNILTMKQVYRDAQLYMEWNIISLSQH